MSAESSPANVVPVAAATPAAAVAPAADAALEKYYRIESSEKTIYKISVHAIRHSQTLSNLIGTLNYTVDNDESNTIPMADIAGIILDLCIKYCEHHKNEQPPVNDEILPRNFVISDFDQKLMNVDNDVLFDLICAANFLDIKGLLDVSCMKVASMVKGKSPDEMRVIFGIPTDEEDEATEKELKEKAAKRAADEKAKKEDAATAAKAAEKKVDNEAGEGPSSV